MRIDPTSPICVHVTYIVQETVARIINSVRVFPWHLILFTSHTFIHQWPSMCILLQYIDLYLIYYFDNNINQTLTSRMERVFIIKCIWTVTTSREALSRIYNHTNSKVQNYQFIYNNLLPPCIYMTYFNVSEYLLLYNFAYNIILMPVLQTGSDYSN
jgi:hypothetical protein